MKMFMKLILVYGFLLAKLSMNLQAANQTPTQAANNALAALNSAIMQFNNCTQKNPTTNSNYCYGTNLSNINNALANAIPMQTLLQSDTIDTDNAIDTLENLTSTIKDAQKIVLASSL